MGLEVAAVVWRFLHFTALVVLLGALLFRLRAIKGAAPELAADEPRQKALAAFDRWLWWLYLITAVVALVSAVGWLNVTAIAMTGDLETALSADVLTVILTETVFGLVWTWRIVMLVVLVVLLVVMGLRRSSKPTHLAIVKLYAMLAGLALTSLSGVGHAIMGEGTAGIAHQVADAVHLFAAAVWLGGLVALARLLAGAAADPVWAALVHHALPRFSTMALIAVGLVVASGVANAVFLLDSPMAPFKTAYGLVLLAKVALVVLMIALGALNKQVLLPRIVASGAADGVAPLSRSVAAEIALGAAVLVIVAVLGTLAPVH
jgi:putative copper resistance protein D